MNIKGFLQKLSNAFEDYKAEEFERRYGNESNNCENNYSYGNGFGNLRYDIDTSFIYACTNDGLGIAMMDMNQ